MKISGITRVRNEAHIIGAALDHAAEICNAGIYVYDDASEDMTVNRCSGHPAVAMITAGREWDPTPEGRQMMEGHGRQVVYDQALADGADYIYCFDADEFAEPFYNYFDGATADAYAFRLFDFHITPEDVGASWRSRRWMGPEYRDIPMVFKARPRVWRDRIPEHTKPAPIAGHVRHYGKAISVEEWESTCEYYAGHRFRDNDAFREKWIARKGRAIHTSSDFGRPLIEWEDRSDTSKIVKL